MSTQITLHELEGCLGAVEIIPAETNPEISIDRVTEDSRKVGPGSLFVAVQGERSDGHDYIDEAVGAGAVALLSECELSNVTIPVLVVPHARRALGLIAHRLQGDPSVGMTVIGVTGTNGKSSTVTIIEHISRSAGHTVACFGTLGYIVAGKHRDAPHTTPFNEDLAALFGEARDAGCTHVVMEVSSHALEQERVSGIAFDGAVFTNLTQDHLDYHADMDEYRDEKLKLFRSITPETGFTVANAEDPCFDAFAEAGARIQWAFGEGGDVFAEDVHLDANRTDFMLDTPWGRARCSMGLLGQHNVSNFLGAVAVCGAMGISIDSIAEAARTLPSIPGRFEAIDCGQPYHVIVDYAHTEDGLRNVLIAARAICSGTLRVVFGCGGDRDKTKRPKMAVVAAELADYGIITSDNPRSESPERILLDTEVGMQRAGKKRGSDYEVMENRKEAIESALDAAEAGDLVMIAGKGHEDYQILNTGTIHFDDREVARAWLEANG